MDDLLDTLRLAIHNIRKTGLVKDGETVQSSALKIKSTTTKCQSKRFTL